jgi:hypothetical protein
MYESFDRQEAPEYPAVYRNLMAVGLLGAIYRREQDSDVINEAVELTLQDPAPFRVCRAIAQGVGGNASYARQQLLARLEQQPDDDTAKVALAVALMFCGDPEWKRWLDNVLATSSDQNARDTANGVLSYLSGLDFGRMH